MFGKAYPWAIAAGVLAVVVTSLGIGTSWSYLKTAWRSVGESIRDATPISFELKRLDGMIQDLQPEIRRIQQVVARLEVELEYLEKEVAQLQEEQEKLVAQMRTLRQELGSGKEEFVFAGQSYSRAEVERDLARRLDLYQEKQVVLAAKQELLEQKRRTLENARLKLAEYRRAYDRLLVQSQSLKAKLQRVEAQAAAGEPQVDTSKLAEAQELAKQIEVRLRTIQRILTAPEVNTGEIPLESTPRSAVERFDELFGAPTAGKGPET
ncbi:MAG: hypothetical protein NZ899_12500 [Thermoguttaceae bacterium]|nr:hypothetical protein [Thermoguttaceae bacterium]MDW8078481.1 hypothetical protein [Thermoguttaceae bacterium]